MACFYLLCASRVQCWESPMYLIGWCLTGITSKCRQTISLPETGRGAWQKCIQRLFYLLQFATAVKCCFYLCHSTNNLKGHGHCCQHSIQKINILYINSECAEDQHFCHLSEKCHSEEDPDSVCRFLLFEERCFGMCCVFISASSWTMWPGDLKIVSSPSYYFCVTFL